MNKNTIIGFVLIGAILIGFSWYNTREFEKQQREQFVADSIAQVEAMKNAPKIDSTKIIADSLKQDLVAVATDSNRVPIYKDSLLEEALKAKPEFFKLENDKISVDFTTKGGQVNEVLIKNYYTYDSLSLYLVKKGASNFGIDFFTDQQINTSDFNFKKVAQTDTSLVMRLPFGQDSFVEYSYILPIDSYLLTFNVRMVGMNKFISRSVTQLGLDWKLDLPRLEKGYDNEKNYSSIVYKFPKEKGVEDLGLRKENASEDLPTKLEWFAFQQQFFSAIMVADNNFTSGKLAYSVYPQDDPSNNLMACTASMQVPYSSQEQLDIPFKFYYGPNLYKTLKSHGYGFEKIVPLGGWLIGWINRVFIINFFDYLSKFIGNFGIIILLMTIAIKIIISPLTLKSYMSSAKMKVLKPEIDKINEKFPKKEDALKKQQETMSLYKKTGVSMFGGCLPILLQFPILFAMFKFFPASFELRQEGFLWVKDLSSYDSIMHLPFSIPLYGDHVSLFALLMGVSMFFYARMTIDQMPSGPQMAGMKGMQLYFMPIFFTILCNNFSSGLSYYYMLSNLITMLQTWIIRRFFVDEKKIYAKLKEKAANSKAKPKSKFQQRLDEMYKQQQAMQQGKNKK